MDYFIKPSYFILLLCFGSFYSLWMGFPNVQSCESIMTTVKGNVFFASDFNLHIFTYHNGTSLKWKQISCVLKNVAILSCIENHLLIHGSNDKLHLKDPCVKLSAVFLASSRITSEIMYCSPVITGKCHVALWVRVPFVLLGNTVLWPTDNTLSFT